MPLQREDDHEASMARADLFKCAQYSFKLFKMIHDGQELEGWVQAKITKAADYIASVYHYMEYEMKFSEYGEQIENSDMYSESQRRALTNLLTEAKGKMKELTKAQAKKVKESSASKKAKKDYDGDGEVESGKDEYLGSKIAAAKKAGKIKEGMCSSCHKDPCKCKDVKEGKKPDFLDLDKDGNKKEPMKKAVADKKVKEASHQEKTTMKHVKNPTAGEKQAAKDIKPGIKGYADRVAMLKSAEKDGRLKNEGFPTVDDAKKNSQGTAGMKAGEKKKSSTGGTIEKTKTGIKHTAGKNYSGKSAEADKKVKEAQSPFPSRNAGTPAADAAQQAAGQPAKKVQSVMPSRNKPTESTGDYSAKKAAAGKDIGKPGKNFAKIEKSAGGGEKGKRIAGAVLAKLRKG